MSRSSSNFDESSLQADLRRTLDAGSHQVVFIDDGGAGNHPYDPSVLVQDHLTYTAIIVPPGELAPLHSDHANWLASAQKDAPEVEELHTTRLINPSGGQPWHGVEMEVRARHMLAAAELFVPRVECILHGRIGKAQYEELVTPVLKDQSIDTHPAIRRSLKRHSSGLEFVFQRVISHLVRKTGIPTVIIQDEDKLRQKIKIMFDEDIPIWSNGIIYHPSETWPGIQVADLLSVALSRLYCIEDKRRKNQSKNVFDDVCEEICAKMNGKLIDAWKLIDVLEPEGSECCVPWLSSTR